MELFIDMHRVCDIILCYYKPSQLSKRFTSDSASDAFIILTSGSIGTKIKCTYRNHVNVDEVIKSLHYDTFQKHSRYLFGIGFVRTKIYS